MNGYGVSSGANRMCASSRPCATTATGVTRFAASRNGPTSPAMSKISSVLGKMASALECSDCRGARLDDARREAAPGALVREKEADRPGADDQDIEIGRAGRHQQLAILVLSASRRRS